MTAAVHVFHNDLHVDRTEGTGGNANGIAEIEDDKRGVNSADAQKLVGRLCAYKPDIL